MTAMHDGEANARNGAKDGDARETDDREPELPVLNAIESAQIGEIEHSRLPRR